MSTTTQKPDHKRTYDNFIAPKYSEEDESKLVEIEEIYANKFQAFMDQLIADIPDEGKPANGYLYNTHAGAFVRALDEAKDHYVKARKAFSCKQKTS